jgi:hypothetical protein
MVIEDVYNVAKYNNKIVYIMIRQALKSTKIHVHSKKLNLKHM